MTEERKADPRVLMRTLERCEERYRNFSGLAARLRVSRVEVDNVTEVPRPVSGWLSFFSVSRDYAKSKDVRTETDRLNEDDKRALSEALDALANKEAAAARRIAEELGTKARL